MNWDDLRFLLALARSGSLSAAAATLGVNHTTVSRRLAELERELGAKLLHRTGTALRLTPAGERVAAHASRVEAQCLALDRDVRGEDSALSGRVRVTAVDLVAGELAPALVRFAEKHPHITVELQIDGSLRDLARGDADVAVRVTPARPPEHLVGRRIGAVRYAVFGAEGLAPDAPWIAWGNAAQRESLRAWLASAEPSAAVRFEVDAPSVALALAHAGAGWVLFPTTFGTQTKGLQRSERHRRVEKTMDLWLLTHADLRNAARIRALMNCLADALAPYMERKA